MTIDIIPRVPLLMEQARALGLHLARLHHAVVIEPTDFIGTATRALISHIGLGNPLERVSTTIPDPIGPAIIYLADAAVADPVSFVEVMSHEATHARQIVEIGVGQVVVDYLGSGELRATREAGPYVVGLFARCLLTGIRPTVEDAMASLGSGLYHLDAEEVQLGRGIVTSGVETILAGAVPPYVVAVEMLAWLRANAPLSIFPEPFQAHDAVLDAP